MQIIWREIEFNQNLIKHDHLKLYKEFAIIIKL